MSHLPRPLISLKEGLPWLFAFVVMWIFLLSATRVMNHRVADGRAPWDSDYAMFYQAGRLFSHGEFAEVYRYFSSDPSTKENLPDVWKDYLASNGGWSTYYYGQTPWHAMAMVIPSILSFRWAYIVASVLNVFAMLLSAMIVWKTSHKGLTWGSLILLLPIFAPVVGGYQWEPEPFQFQWDVWSTPEIGTRGNALTAAMWLGQPTPVILLFLVLYLVCTWKKKYAFAGLFAILAIMKPSVAVVLPLALLLTDEWGKLLKWSLIWATVFSVFYSIIPGLGFPDSFIRVAFSYSNALLPNILQTHNWVWIYGCIVTTVALRYGK